MSVTTTHFELPPTQPVDISYGDPDLLTFWPPTPNHEGVAQLLKPANGNEFSGGDIEVLTKLLQNSQNQELARHCNYLGVQVFWNGELPDPVTVEATIPHIEQVNSRLGNLCLDGARFTGTDGYYTAREFMTELHDNGRVLVANTAEEVQVHDILAHVAPVWSLLPPRAMEHASQMAGCLLGKNDKMLTRSMDVLDNHMCMTGWLGEKIRHSLQPTANHRTWEHATGTLRALFKPELFGLKPVTGEEFRLHVTGMLAKIPK